MSNLRTDPADFQMVETWIFDLDNTLYHPSARLFDQIDQRMTAFIMRALGVDRPEADRLRRVYWERYGITLRGLIDHHGIGAADFLEDVHDIDLGTLAPDPALAAAIGALPGKRIVHTNGPRAHAARVLAARGLDGLFDAVFGIEDKGLIPKPHPQAYDRIAAATGLEPARAMMIEDDARNLAVPKARGMRTVWITHGADADPGPHAAHVDLRIDCLVTFLGDRG